MLRIIVYACVFMFYVVDMEIDREAVISIGNINFTIKVVIKYPEMSSNPNLTTTGAI